MQRARHRASRPQGLQGLGMQQLTHGRPQQRPAKPPRYLQAMAPSAIINSAAATAAKNTTFRRIAASYRLRTDDIAIKPQRRTSSPTDPSAWSTETIPAPCGSLFPAIPSADAPAPSRQLAASAWPDKRHRHHLAKMPHFTNSD
jgi:hypothetical protein